jgi:hypothetical protein
VRSTANRLLESGFESRRRHGCLSVVSVACCRVKVSSTGRSLVQRNPTDCGVSFDVIYKLKESGGTGPRWAVEPQIKNLRLSLFPSFLQTLFSSFPLLS